ncbi:hypothetical protein [Limnohabitans sp.]|uniref:hypothetical protein n=1 Tax=Limnohabitans sp. TaxID=1907725 RepID=UPI00286F5312|nr:hypothetical protein [Limnohabitans sp.]
MADQNDLSKPDGTSSYQTEVWQTVRGHIARLWSGDYAGMGGLITGMRRWVISSGSNVKLLQRNASGTEDVLFDSANKVDTSAINSLVTTATVNTVTGNSIDCSKGIFFTKSISASTGLSFTNVPTGTAYGFVLVVSLNGGPAITWPSSVSWPSSVAPTLLSNKKNIFQFLTNDGGANWFGASQTNY